MAERLRNSVICEHCQLRYVFELTQTLRLEMGPYITNEDLCSFVKVNLVPLEYGVILEVREVASEYLQEFNG